MGCKDIIIYNLLLGYLSLESLKKVVGVAIGK